LKWRPWWRLDV